MDDSERLEMAESRGNIAALSLRPKTKIDNEPFEFFSRVGGSCFRIVRETNEVGPVLPHQGLATAAQGRMNESA
jgi:hypothetical protein